MRISSEFIAEIHGLIRIFGRKSCLLVLGNLLVYEKLHVLGKLVPPTRRTPDGWLYSCSLHLIEQNLARDSDIGARKLQDFGGKAASFEKLHGARELQCI